MIDAIQRFASAFVAGELDPDRTHWILLAGAIAAEFAVAAGIVLESPKEKGWREWLGLVLVFGGVVVSAVFTISLFMFDEGISRGQKDKIITLETRLAPRVLTKEQVDAILTLRGNVRAVSVLSSPDIEPTMFSAQLQEILFEAGVAPNPIPAPPGTRWVGMWICLPNNETTKENPLWKVFFAIGLNPTSCSLDDPTLSIPRGVPRDIPLVIVGERLPFFPNGKPPSYRFRAYPGLKLEP
jgi:hypothetical protein